MPKHEFTPEERARGGNPALGGPDDPTERITICVTKTQRDHISKQAKHTQSSFIRMLIDLHRQVSAE